MMKMSIKGSYVIRCGNKTLRGTNIITTLGESFFMNRLINNGFDPLKYIVLGNSSIQAKKNDTRMGNETVRKRCVSEANLNTKQIILYCSCSVKEILGATEIGVANDEVLISHDVFEAIDDEFITENIDSVEITYTFDLSTSSQRTNWQYYSEVDTGGTTYNIYYIVEENPVVGVFEQDANIGYRGVRSIDALKLVEGAYYYDNASGTLFIRTLNTDNPNNYRILISY